MWKSGGLPNDLKSGEEEWSIMNAIRVAGVLYCAKQRGAELEQLQGYWDVTTLIPQAQHDVERRLACNSIYDTCAEQREAQRSHEV